jgi:hypothetical protein
MDTDSDYPRTRYARISPWEIEALLRDCALGQDPFDPRQGLALAASAFFECIRLEDESYEATEVATGGSLLGVENPEPSVRWAKELDAPCRVVELRWRGHHVGMLVGVRREGSHEHVTYTLPSDGIADCFWEAICCAYVQVDAMGEVNVLFDGWAEPQTLSGAHPRARCGAEPAIITRGELQPMGRLLERLRKPTEALRLVGAERAQPQMHIRLGNYVQRIPRPLAAAACVALVLVLGATVAYAGYRAGRSAYEAVLARMSELKRDYEGLAQKVPIEQAITPTVEAFASEPGGLKNQVRVTLSPRIEEGLVRAVHVDWGDGASETLYDSQGVAQRFQAVRGYPLPVSDDANEWRLKVVYEIPDSVAAAMRPVLPELTKGVQVYATRLGLQVTAVGSTAISPPVSLQAESVQDYLTFVSPKQGQEAGWKVMVSVRSSQHTPLLTLLVHPEASDAWYVQPGARRLAAGASAEFTIQLGGSRSSDVGKRFDIMLIANDQFQPTKGSLMLSDVPTSSEAARMSVTKVAGLLADLPQIISPGDPLPVSGTVFTQDGAVLLVKDPDGRCRVVSLLENLRPDEPFAQPIELQTPGQYEIALAVRQLGADPLQLGQNVDVMPQGYRICGPRHVRVESKKGVPESGE